MNTGQIIIITIMCILSLIGFIGVGFAKTENQKICWAGLMLMVFSLMTMLVCSETASNNELQKQVKEKCPQYEKVDSVYRLKIN